MTKQLLYDKEARKKLKEGVDIVANAVKVTLGPKGRNVVISRPHKGEPDIVNDGATIARNIVLKDLFQEQGVELIKSIAIKTEASAGDGTTTSAILAQSLIEFGLQAIAQGANPVLLKKGIETATQTVIEELKKMAIEVKPEDLNKIAILSAEDEQIGNTIAEIIQKYGKDAAISVEDGGVPGISYEAIEGYKFESGWISPYMVNRPEKFQTIIEDPVIAILDRRITMVTDLIPLIEIINKQFGKTEAVIIAEAIEGEALATLLLNKMQGRFLVLGINAPSFGKRRKDTLEDMAIFTGATVIAAEAGMTMKDVKPEMFGRAKKIISTREETVIIGGAGSSEEVDERVNQLKYLHDQTDNTPEYYLRELEDRIGKLTGTAVILRIGYDSHAEATYKKLKVEDTIAATKAAIEEGILPGGGSPFFWLAYNVNLTSKTSDEQDGINTVMGALQEPIKQLIKNSGGEVDKIINEIGLLKDYKMGYNALTGKIVNLLEENIVDPLKVERLALINAVSVAKTLLTAEVVIVDEPEEKK